MNLQEGTVPPKKRRKRSANKPVVIVDGKRYPLEFWKIKDGFLWVHSQKKICVFNLMKVTSFVVPPLMGENPQILTHNNIQTFTGTPGPAFVMNPAAYVNVPPEEDREAVLARERARSNRQLEALMGPNP